MRTFFIVALVLSGYSQSALAAEKVGVILPLVGDFAQYGKRVQTGVQQGADEGQKLVFEDEGCMPSTAVSAFQRLSSTQGIRLFIGPMCASPQVAVGPLLARTESLAILGAASPERVFEVSGGRMLSVQHSTEQESEFNAEQMYRLGIKRVVILFAESDYGRSHEAAFRKHFKGEVLETITYNEDSTTLPTLVAKIGKSAPDALYVPDAAPLLHGLTKHLRSLGDKKPRLFSVYSTQSPEVLSVAGSTGEGMIYSYPKIEGDALEYFPRLAMTILKAGIKSCPGGEAVCVRQALLKQFPFDKSGVLHGEIGLKTIQNGAFVWLTP